VAGKPKRGGGSREGVVGGEKTRDPVSVRVGGLSSGIYVVEKDPPLEKVGGGENYKEGEIGQ